jgi:hypothetical protein
MPKEGKRKILFSKGVWTSILLLCIVAYPFVNHRLEAKYSLGILSLIMLVYGVYTMYDLTLKSPEKVVHSNISDMPTRNPKAVNTEEELKRKSIIGLWLEAAYLYSFRLSFIVLVLAFIGQVSSDLRPTILVAGATSTNYFSHLLAVICGWWNTAQWLLEQVGLHPGFLARFDWRDWGGAAFLSLVYSGYLFAVTSCGGALVKIGRRKGELERRVKGHVGTAAAAQANVELQPALRN